uniref:Agglutinin C-terminal domain-containing protein n=1 Tax=viral metagenome TaxID=1070528 RepID=A0A6M3KWV3_9ZZZZ
MCIITEHAKALRRLKELEAGEFYETQQPVSTKQIESSDLYKLLREYLPKAEINLSENYRRLCNSNDIAVFLAQDQTNKIDYVSDRPDISSYDCNVFANRLMGQFSVPGWSDLCFGKVWLSSPAHALCCLIDEDQNFWWVEPQTDELLEWITYQPNSVRFIEM